MINCHIYFFFYRILMSNIYTNTLIEHTDLYHLSQAKIPAFRDRIKKRHATYKQRADFFLRKEGGFCIDSGFYSQFFQFLSSFFAAFFTRLPQQTYTLRSVLFYTSPV